MDHVDRILEQWAKERPDLDTRAMGLIGRLKRLHERLSVEVARVYNGHGLSAASFDVLATLRRSGPPYALSPSALVQWTMVTSGTMTNRLDRLESAGLIERRPNPADGRSSVVALTDAGFKLIDTVVAEHAANETRLMDELSPETAEQLNAALKEWLTRLGPDDGADGDRG